MEEVLGVLVPEYLDGHPILGPRAKGRNHIFAARDLIDEVMDRIRCVRTKRFKYIRNYNPENGYHECEYVQRNRPMLPVIQQLHAEGKLTDAQKVIVQETKLPEELYDLETDPFELNNLIPVLASEQNAGAENEALSNTLHHLRNLLDEWIADTSDKGIERHLAAQLGN